MLVILSAGTAPGLALLSYFYLKDHYEKETFKTVLKTFLYGVCLVLPIMFLQYIFQVEQVLNGPFAQAFLQASLLEEFVKWFFLLYIIYPHVDFDEPYDGIIFGAGISLGFATLENILYLVANGVEHALTRAMLPVSSHALFGVIMGYYIGKAKFSYSHKRVFLFSALIVPVILHGVYDYILLTLKFWIYWILPFMGFLWWLALKKAKKARDYSVVHTSKLFSRKETG
ncbi:intramembrane metalloprotease PrsW [Peribacillus psychrosaccharolyticus]|uniref:Protease PrsW n=1 Tax=Peribacillus psychrosaccharolyticus TaxID=1407 RepID=A0A974S014_PERPY|nr:glutamic-type intramembrane protease PrsW [Peribacillus psychrosaccharolyticus]MEC2056743.1 glutamic-type intramembrane protease PrsW [Peribacillus psychrosaccharolyticus]MED3746197.1 glutamic-type intramembrane protease PrsW [Peribacillus psychrosaccharolyticus]QQT00132.1 intramembrane metalloprotease PrsW [Peribacillus psychrosaccharolyticus]